MPRLMPLQKKDRADAGTEMPERQMPSRTRSIACVCSTGSACGREVTVGDALATTALSDLRDLIRRRLGSQASGLSDACDELVGSVCYWWPQAVMARIARRRAEMCADALGALAVIEAKVREDVEARFGVDPNTLRALDLLLPSIVMEMTSLWFHDAESRISMRRAMAAARQRQS